LNRKQRGRYECYWGMLLGREGRLATGEAIVEPIADTRWEVIWEVIWGRDKEENSGSEGKNSGSEGKNSRSEGKNSRMRIECCTPMGGGTR
jgi:hypothetical protein